MKISLIQSKFLRDPYRVSEPLNLGYLASFLKTEGYRDIKIHCSIFESDRKIIQEASKADVVGITAPSPTLTHAYILANEIKKKNSNVIIVFGGVHPTALPEETLNNKNVDYVVRGEGEATFYELVKTIEGNGKINKVSGISYRMDGAIHHANERELIQDLDTLPYPARYLFRQEEFIKIGYRKLGISYVSILSSRGCPFECIGCSQHCIWRRTWRPRSPGNIIGEIKEVITKYNAKGLDFDDDNFALSKERILTFCELVVKEKLKFSWRCYVHVDTVDRETLQVMKNAGCSTVCIGVESGSPKILKELKKEISIETIKNVFKVSKEINLRTFATFMIGLPSDDFNTIKETELLLDEIKPDYVGLYIITPYPGSKFYNEAKEKGYLNDIIDWAKLDYDKATMPTVNLTKEELNREYRRLAKKVAHLRNRGRFSIWYIFYKGIIELRNTPFSEFKFLIFKFHRYLRTILFAK